jgi:hypothetical protein
LILNFFGQRLLWWEFISPQWTHALLRVQLNDECPSLRHL